MNFLWNPTTPPGCPPASGPPPWNPPFLPSPVFIGFNPPDNPAPGSLWWNGSAFQVWDGVRWDFIGPTAVPYIPPPVAIAGTASGLRINASGQGVLAQAQQVILYDGTNFSTVFGVDVVATTGAVGAGGIDQGGLVSSAWYVAWLIAGSGQVSLMLSLSPSSPVMPPGYTARAILGWVRSAPSGGVVHTYQIGKRAQYIFEPPSLGSTPPPMIASGVQGSFGSGGTGSITWVPVSILGVTPPSVSAIAVSVGVGSAGGTSSVTSVAPNGNYGNWATQTASPFTSVGTAGGGVGAPVYGEMVIESTNIYYAGTETTSFVQCLGWWDGF